MKHFEMPRIEIERFVLVDTLAVSLIIEEETPDFTLPDDDF